MQHPVQAAARDDETNRRQHAKRKHVRTVPGTGSAVRLLRVFEESEEPHLAHHIGELCPYLRQNH